MKQFFTAFLTCLVASVAVAAGPEVEIIAHRGASYDAPENTVAAIREAWVQGADGTEVDIYLTADGQIIGVHDKTTKRTSNADLNVSQSTFSDLRELDAGSWKNPKFAGEKLPSFAEILAAVPHDKKIYIEVKCGPEIVPQMVKELKAEARPLETTIVICFNADVVAAVKESWPELPAMYLHGMKDVTAKQVIETARRIHADGVDLRAGEELTQEFADEIHAAGLRLDVWTVNDPELAKRMVKIGVKGITTDRPAFLREELSK